MYEIAASGDFQGLWKEGETGRLQVGCKLFHLAMGEGKGYDSPPAPIIISGVQHEILAPSVLPPTGSRRTSCPPLRPVHAFALGDARQRIGFRYGWPGSLRLKASSPQWHDCLQGLVAGLQGRLLRHGAHHTKKGGPVRHFHHVEDEWFYVLEGEYAIEVGGTLHKLTAGDSLLGPRGVPHAFAYIGNTSGKLLITYAPGGRMEEFFTAQDQRPSGRTYGGNIEMMAAYGMTYTGPPLSVS
jgi:mannose-6-phosphate isomerase-like protein (cupin superfamily)